MRLVASLVLFTVVSAFAAEAADAKRPRTPSLVETEDERPSVAPEQAMTIQVLRPQTRLTYRFYTPGGANDPGGGTAEGPPPKRR